MDIAREVKHSCCKVSEQSINYLNFNPLVDSTVMELPDN